MSAISRSLLDLRSLKIEQLKRIFSFADQIKKGIVAGPASNIHRSVALLFFEPSTRTRFSFEIAGKRAGLAVHVLDPGPGTSLEKGETIEDTILNIAAMKPDIFVIRCGDEVPLSELVGKLQQPVISAGWGTKGHPTQALLDAFTLSTHWTEMAGKKLLFVGDVKHSRVAQSHFELLQTLGVEVGVCAPKEFSAQLVNSVASFEDLDQALSWADAVMALRVQFERHSADTRFTVEEYRRRYGLNTKRLQKLNSKAFILHPGPINYGIEMEKEVLTDPRSLILTQVEHGVYLREALLRLYLEGLS